MKSRAYTLLELVLVMAIMAILLTAISLKADVVEKYRAKQQIKELVLDLNYVRNFAEKTNTRTSLNITDKGYSFTLADEKKDVIFSKYIKITEKNVNDIKFTGLGKPAFPKSSNTSGHIYFQIDDKKYRVTIVPVTGKINYYDNYDENDKEKTY